MGVRNANFFTDWWFTRRTPPAPAPPIALNLTIKARNQIFIRGDGLFAELGGNFNDTWVSDASPAAPGPPLHLVAHREGTSVVATWLHPATTGPSPNGPA